MGNRLPTDPFHSSSTLSKLRSILGWRPTGWSHRQSSNTQTSMKPPRNGIVLEQKKGDIHIYGSVSKVEQYRGLLNVDNHLF
ncbi:unnamed protein product [Schistosoma mattheei]|uniref:Uncharacterized protein n=1 Tax=Schistosoma mattheei TaxID=31246 RepID=A0A3P8D948_9TREM|nr:unnamed protein product [Schistosoma mattheei]